MSPGPQGRAAPRRIPSAQGRAGLPASGQLEQTQQPRVLGTQTLSLRSKVLRLSRNASHIALLNAEIHGHTVIVFTGAQDRRNRRVARIGALFRLRVALILRRTVRARHRLGKQPRRPSPLHDLRQNRGKLHDRRQHGISAGVSGDHGTASCIVIVG